MVEATGIFDCKIRLFSKSYSEPPEVSFLLGFKIAIDAWGFTCGDISSWWLSSLSLILSQKQNTIKTSQNVNRLFIKEAIWIASKHIKRWLTPEHH